MKTKLLYLSIVLIFLCCCSTKLSVDEIENSLFNNSYLAIINNTDTLEIEFSERNTVNNYTWQALYMDYWDINEERNKTYLASNFEDYKLVRITKNGFVFKSKTNKIQLINIDKAIFNKSLLEGSWVEERDYWYIEGIAYSLPPPCPPPLFQDAILIPMVQFKNDTLIVNDFCEHEIYKYSFNSKFGAISFDYNEYSSHYHKTLETQWKIKYINSDTLIIDRRYRVDRETNYDYNKIYIKNHSFKKHITKSQ